MPYPYYNNGNYAQNFTQSIQPSYNQNMLVRVKTEAEVWNYPVAPGNSVLFIDENAEFIYSKTMDASQLDRPKIEKYKLVKMTVEGQEPEPKYATVEDLNRVKDEVKTILAEQIAQVKAEMPVNRIDSLLAQGDDI